MKAELVSSAGPAPLANYSEAFKVGHLVFAAGQLATDFRTGVPPEARVDPNFPYYGSDIKRQTKYILDNCRRTFEAADSSLDNIVKAQVYLRDMRDFAGFDEVWKEYFQNGLPTRTAVGTTDLLAAGPKELLEIDLIGHTNDVKHEVISSGGPRPLANYTEAIKVGNLVFTAGQLANDFVSGVPAEATINPEFPYYGSEIKLQTRYILENLKRTLAAADSSLDNAVKAQVFLRDLADFNGFNEAWNEFFGENPPAQTTVGTTELLASGPRQLVEIDVIAHTNAITKKVVASDGPRPVCRYAEAVVVDGLVFTSGQLATDFKTGIPEEARVNPAFPFYGSDVKLQTRYILGNLRKTLDAAGSSPAGIFKAHVFLTDLRNFSAYDEVWKQNLSVPLPSRTAVGTTGLLVKDALVEIDVVAAVGD